ncbi:isocitrate/isopropylmalate family dehydrogenase [Bacillus licheniformis]|nr:isocitrate/isopropylmalate family dehydrogenase [Bacillus licheniformis]
MPGDGIGPEVLDAAVDVLKALLNIISMNSNLNTA